ncbi:ABC transporter substrate-binding protein [Altererythrobacter salegens]|uniref:ABC transporter substrate-binding protein n=1 Tax=Croceibacterium salegens TaxID=1737568 RepID=A0A6I4SUU6_9SPHN|nr:ABC transporter substrate-binding protein [Croceibacterium salegens]MXO59248.1 ABC transporter substrate-binding protein [Croceibacterium salegens]
MIRAAAVLALAIAGCAQPAPAPSEHPTIVSLNPCADAILAEVADRAQLLALSHYSHDPRATSLPLAEAKRFRITGGTVEEVLALSPDVVVGDSFMAPATRAAFERLDVRVETVGIDLAVADSEAQVRRLAKLAGHPERGEALVGRIEAALAETQRTGPPVSAILWQQGGIVAGGNALAANLMVHTGFTSQSAARGLRQGAYLPLERVLADPPRLILSAGDGREQHHPALRKLKGVTYAEVAPNLLYCGGPTIPRLARRLAAVRDSL